LVAPWRSILLGCDLVLTIPLVGIAQSSVPAVPSGIGARLRDSLENRRNSLIARDQSHDAKEPAFIAKCGRIQPGDAATISACTAEFTALQAEATAISGDKRRFATGIALLTAVNTDPMVVDGRGARDGASLTAQVPSLAKSPAADRIDKGFQAVVAHDWPVALAWWQEALQRDPSNSALKLSVDLAQWMVDSRKPKAGPASSLSEGIHAAARGDNAEAVRQFEVAKAANPASGPYIDNMIAALRDKSSNAVKIASENYRFELMLEDYAQDEFDAGLFFLMTGNDREAAAAFAKSDYLARGLPPDRRPPHARRR
jgi:hypothetical protein